MPRVQVHAQTHRFLHGFLADPGAHGRLRSRPEFAQFLSPRHEIEGVGGQCSVLGFGVHAHTPPRGTDGNKGSAVAVADGNAGQRRAHPHTVDVGQAGRTVFIPHHHQEVRINRCVGGQHRLEEPSASEVFIATFGDRKRSNLIGVGEHSLPKRHVSNRC